MTAPAQTRSAAIANGAGGARLKRIASERGELRTLFVHRFWLRWRGSPASSRTLGEVLMLVQ